MGMPPTSTAAASSTDLRSAALARSSDFAVDRFPRLEIRRSSSSAHDRQSKAEWSTVAILTFGRKTPDDGRGPTDGKPKMREAGKSMCGHSRASQRAVIRAR